MRGRWLLLAVVLLFGILAQGQWVIWEQNFETEQLSDREQVKVNVDWWIVDRTWFYAEPAEVRNFPSGSKALYFGKIKNGKGTYETGKRVTEDENITYTQRTVPSGFELDSSWIRVSFKYLREVEDFQWDNYDITRVWIPTTPPTHVWVKTSKDPSEKQWKSFVSEPLKTEGVVVVKVEFDSVDVYSNNYFGWLVDDVKVEAVVVIEDSTLDEAEVNAYYYNEIHASGGMKMSPQQYRWQAEGLPEGLRFKPMGTYATIEGRPVKAGIYQVKITVMDFADEASKRAGYPECPASSYTRTYTLVVRPQGSTSAHGKIEVSFGNLGPGPDIPGWTRTPTDGFWHLNPWYGAACYFDRNSVPPSYDTGRRTYGELTSPKWNVSDRRGQEIRVSFEYFRSVEFNRDNPVAGYDKTYVEIRFDEGPWFTIWYKDSKDESPETGTANTSEDLEGNPLVVPNTADTMQIRFVFDSVDGIDNGHPGWYIYWLQIEFMAGDLEIVTQELPRAEVGVYYEVQLEARGGKPAYDWTTESRLPRGLRLERTGKLCGIPEESGAFNIMVKVTDQDNNEAYKTLPLAVTQKTTLFNDDFEAELNKWLLENLGLWHRTKTVKGVDLAGHGYVMYYGKDDTTNPNYDTGTRTVGYLTSEEFNLDGANAFKITFDYWHEVEFYGAGGYDRTYIQVRFFNGTTWTSWYTLWSKDCAATSEKTWTTATVGPYSVPSGATKMQIRFVFDSVDRFYNNYVGWLIDNVKVIKASSGSSLPTSSLMPTVAARGEVTFQNIPNPVRDVHTTTFVVRGVEAERIRVEVYDLTGKLVWKGEGLGNELTWHTEDLTGLPLANGVYLYKVYVKVGEAWIVSDTRKLVILR